MTDSQVSEICGTMGNALSEVAKSITPDLRPERDAAGGMVQSLTEAVMGITSGLFSIASELSRIASAMEAPDETVG